MKTFQTSDKLTRMSPWRFRARCQKPMVNIRIRQGQKFLECDEINLRHCREMGLRKTPEQQIELFRPTMLCPVHHATAPGL